MRERIVLMVVFTILLNAAYVIALKAQMSPSKVMILPVSDKGTRAVVFHAPIKAVDRGADDLLAQKMNDTILKVKAATNNLERTNLSVVTADGILHYFIIIYDDGSGMEPIDVVSQHGNRVIANSEEVVKETDISHATYSVLNAQPFMYGPRGKCEQVSLRLAGLYFDKGIMYIQLLVNNLSALPYDIDFIRAAILDKRKRKRGTRQEVELKPISTSVPAVPVMPLNRHAIVLALPQFAITRDKKLQFQLYESSGGRHITLSLGSKRLLRFRSLAEITTHN